MSTLQERLRRLRGDGPTADAARGPTPTLAERLRRLDPGGRRAGLTPRPTPGAAWSASALAASLGAELVAPGLLRREQHWPLQRPQGRERPADTLTTLAELLPGAANTQCHVGALDPTGWVFIDTETSGLAGGTGTWVFVCGLARIDGDRLRCCQWLLTRLDAEAAMMEQLSRELAAAGLWISFNGKTFDLPLLDTRLRLTGQPGLPAALPHLDLLYPLRRAFARRWPDCRLATAEQRLLGFARTDDLPGAEAPAAWLAWLQQGNPERLGAVLQHNLLDLVSLAALVPALARVQREPLAHGADALAIARHLARSGQADAARRLLAAAVSAPVVVRASGSGADHADARLRLALAAMHRRARDWPAALALWQPLADQGEPDALLALAKYHEHVAHDPVRALALAQRLPAGPARDLRCQRLRAACLVHHRDGG